MTFPCAAYRSAETSRRTVGRRLDATFSCFCWYWCLVALALFAVGCGGAGYDEVPVSGIVTFDDEPLAHVHLSFQPMAKDESGFGPGSFGRTDAQGKFSLRTVWPDAPGAIVGVHRVTISYEDPALKPPNVTIPREYVEGTATFEVPEGGTENADISLRSKN